jgi:hypothetical protein
MADASGAHLNTGAQMEKWGCGCPRGSKNKSKDPSTVDSLSVSMKWLKDHIEPHVWFW